LQSLAVSNFEAVVHRYAQHIIQGDTKTKTFIIYHLNHSIFSDKRFFMSPCTLLIKSF